MKKEKSKLIETENKKVSVVTRGWGEVGNGKILLKAYKLPVLR